MGDSNENRFSFSFSRCFPTEKWQKRYGYTCFTLSFLILAIVANDRCSGYIVRLAWAGMQSCHFGILDGFRAGWGRFA
ncbi:hypothetical protein [Brevibacillus agri]|uniref:hypothetical protein n=1 Tax=Brevibacillus agri TaxID=51101 RepID=UPI0018CF4875|nr:hypothetical protein [Brevibacillus agri]